ncbi:hypothetical protein BDQ17DRAFT_1335980 [Cyathus striatus]|nr:hypothetical protein BDQ17DRAFT_1335980 [Cyathus striatus]
MHKGMKGADVFGIKDEQAPTNGAAEDSGVNAQGKNEEVLGFEAELVPTKGAAEGIRPRSPSTTIDVLRGAKSLEANETIRRVASRCLGFLGLCELRVPSWWMGNTMGPCEEWRDSADVLILQDPDHHSPVTTPPTCYRANARACSSSTPTSPLYLSITTLFFPST